MIKYSIIGAGWRSEFYIRISMLLPKYFKVQGIFIRNKEKQKEFKNKYNINICTTFEYFLKTDCDFIVLCVNKDNINDIINKITDKNIPVLSETPVSQCKLNGKVQVSEQFHFMPRNQAYKTIINSGILGEVNQVQLSCCHDYHAISLIRFFLNTEYEIPEITNIKLIDPITHYNSRSGYLKSPTLENAEQNIKIFKFKNNKTAIYDFSFEQYFSDIRSSRIVIRGTKGEIINNACTYLKNGVPQQFTITRNVYGSNENLDGMSLFNITGNGEILYTNPFKNARLSDEEIAIATVLFNMKNYLKTNNDFYSTKDASFDYQLSRML